jgi:hypothetical protein
MTADEYLWGILAREAVSTGPSSPALIAAGALIPALQQWGGAAIESIRPSGSYAKGTANRSGTDIDLFISLKNGTPDTLKEIYETLFAAMQKKNYCPKRQNVSINVKAHGFDVDLVPGKRQDTSSQDHSLYRRRADTWTKTNVQEHIQYVIGGGRISESRILKLWRNQHSLDFPSFYVEMTVIQALAGRNAGLSENVWQVFTYLRDTFPTARVVDPANTNNIISDDLTAAEKAKVKAAAVAALAASNWSGIIK